jgi:hypothetical protein
MKTLKKKSLFVNQFLEEDGYEHFYVQYWTLYPKSLGTNAFWILGFSGYWIFMQRNFNTDKINNNNYMLRYSLSTKLYKIKILLFSDAFFN